MDPSFYYDDEEPDRRWVKIVAIVLIIGALAVSALWLLNDDGSAGTELSDDTFATASISFGGPTTSPTSASTRTPSSADSTDVSTTFEQLGPATSTTDDDPTADSDGRGSNSTTPAAGTDVAGNSDPGYPTGPDGAPFPVVIVFDTEVINISGMVPSQAAKDRLAVLAKAQSKTEARVVNNAIVNPQVPLNVGVRVIELNSVRFPEGTAEITAAHAEELDRVVTIMKALPNISVLVIGHADQRGSESANFALSDERARATLNYLVYLGVAPSRLLSRGAGATDLLTVGDDETSLALNRRTEFIFFGLIVA